MKNEELSKILQQLFNVPLDVSESADLRQYIQDSIDVGELAAVLRHDYRIDVELNDFKSIYTLTDLRSLIQSKT